MNFVYILKCHDKTYYTGWTNNIEKRYIAHNKGTASKYTRSRRPLTLVYLHPYKTKKEAMQEEYRIKQLTHKQKSQLILSIENQISTYYT